MVILALFIAVIAARIIYVCAEIFCALFKGYYTLKSCIIWRSIRIIPVVKDDLLRFKWFWSESPFVEPGPYLIDSRLEGFYLYFFISVILWLCHQ